MGFSKTSAGVKAQEKIQAKKALPRPLKRMAKAREAAFTHELKDPAKFRSSSLPYCPIIFARETINRYVNGVRPSPVTYFQRFYTTIGTAMHLLWQEVLGAKNEDSKPFGSWKHLDTGEVFTDCFQPKSRRKFPSLLPEWEYVEIEMEYKGLSCHVDFVEFYPKTIDNRTGEVEEEFWVIWDLKTAMSDACKKPEEYLPVIKNVFQIETYMCIFELEFGIRPKYYGLDYQARESHANSHPHLVEWTDKKRAVAMKRLESWADNHKKAQKFVSVMEQMLDQAPDRPDTPDPVPAARTYSPSAAHAAMLPLVESRPCQTKDQYERIMAPCLVFEGGCRHAKLCTNQAGNRLALSLLEAITPRVER